MKAVLQNRSVHYGVMLVVLMLAAYGYFVYIPRTAAEIISTVGTLSVELAPAPSALGTEYVTVRYAGLGQIDIAGYEVGNGDGFTYVFKANTILKDGERIKVCADSVKDTNCDAEWSGGEAWNDESGSLLLRNASGATILEKTYAGATVGSQVDGNTDISQPVLTQKDSVRVCHSADGVSFTGPNGSLKNITTEKGGHGQHEFDIIPSFFYNINGMLGYYPGKNWPDTTGIYAKGCTKK